MLKKSDLLEYVVTGADALRKNDGRKAISANYFIVSLLKTIQDKENDSLAEELSNEQARGELWAADSLLGKYRFVKAEAIESIERHVNSSEYRSSMDEFMYSKLLYSAEAKAKVRGDDRLTVPLYLGLILAEPTDAIRKYVMIPDAEQDAQQPAEQGIGQTAPEDTGDGDGDGGNSFDQLRQSLGFLTGDGEDGAHDSAPASDAPGGAQKLYDIVKTTRDIQNVLLSSVFGQDQAINAFVSGYFQAQLMSCSRKKTRKPQATFLFAGPPGVGKTFLAEKAAEALGLPYRRFDMSEYSDKEANIEFCGSDKVYKNGKAGNVTEFVANNPRCVLLFDEIEKAHLNIIYLFLQLLDAGRLRDNYTDEEVSFTNAVIIFTTNVGKSLYEDPKIVNLASVPRKKILRALGAETSPLTGAPLFPSAICSRFASGNVVMFNRLEANNLLTIVKNELQNNVQGFEDATGIKIKIDDHVPGAIMFSEGGKADARTVKGRTNAFFHEELYELFRLLSADRGTEAISQLQEIRIEVPAAGLDGEIGAMFNAPATPEVLVFADGNMATECAEKLSGRAVCHVVDHIEAAKEILFNRDISVVLCDVNCHVKDDHIKVLNAEDVSSEGQDFLLYVLGKYFVPTFLIRAREEDISREEFLSFAKLGVRDVLTVKSAGDDFADSVMEKCDVAYRQTSMLKLARENKVMTYKTAQSVSDDGKTAYIYLFNFTLGLVTDADDAKSVLDAASRPDLHFTDVIGAEDAKQELGYFVEYLKNPIKYMRQGVRSPKGVLLYGPPGTGKTLLAKAMAGESGVTFLKAEGNEFLKRYVGEGAEAVHALFNAARKYAPSIVFIDEIDAIGKSRDGVGNGDNSGDVLTAFLTEMDGFNTDTTRPVFVLAATNYGVDSARGKSLDAALLRRFDRRIYVDLPNKDERKRYLEMKIAGHASVRLSADQIDNIALRSTGMSLAELESVFEMALRNAIRSQTGVVGDHEFEDAFETFSNGEKKEWNPESLKRTARHESGHALVCWLTGEKPTYLTIVARGDHGGYMQHANSEDKGAYTKAELLGKIRTSLAGRAAEMVYYGAEDGISTGASGDLYSATSIAEQMVCRYGMVESVGMSYVDLTTAGSAENAAVREKVNAILQEELDRAVCLIRENTAAIDAMVDALLKKNHLKEKEIDDIFTRTVTAPDTH